jgi:GNAT superfamily N-acetyltransferase
MSELNFIVDQKENIPVKYHDQLFLLMQENRKEIFDIEPPHLKYFEISWKIPLEKSKQKIWTLVILNNELIGYGYTSLNIMYDNQDIGYFWCHIKKKYRRNGYGSALLQQQYKQFPEQIKIIQTETFKNTDGEKFISNLKEKYQSKVVMSISEIRSFNISEVKQEAERLKQKVARKGYSIIFVNGIDFAKVVDYEEYIEMVEEIWNDMPREELSDEDEILTVERHQIYLKKAIELGYDILTYIAIDEKTKKPIGLTSTTVGKYQPAVAYQDDTGVLKPHRGNGLGLALKYQMLDKLLSDTETKYWQTGNAGSNEHMLRINKLLGYKEFTSIKIIEFSKEELQELL